MHDVAGSVGVELSSPGSLGSPMPQRDDWLAIWIGLGLVVVAVGLFASGSGIGWLAVAPQKWGHWGELIQQLRVHALQYLALLGLWEIVFAIAVRALGLRVLEFCVAFAVIFLAALALYALGQWDQAARYNLEPPLVALLLGMLVSNVIDLPRWLGVGLRVELYVKTGIVVLGAGLPLTLILWAGPVVVAQAGIVSLATFSVIYFTATALGLDRRLAATIGTGGSVCGVSASIAVGGAIGARKEHVSLAISLVVIWAIVMIFVLPLTARGLRLPTGVAGAWIGTSEFADAAGIAAAQAYGGYAGHVAGIAGTADAAVNAFTLMKVIGRDIWIGIWALVLSVIATTYWESSGVKGGSSGDARAEQIWHRFPKFVLGFLIASVLVTLTARGYSYADYRRMVLPGVVAPLQVLRTWAFTFAFLSIGLSTRLKDFVSVGWRPFYAFAAGALVNVLLGLLLSTRVFVHFWSQLGP